MYLSELFLQKIENNYTEENLRRSLESCEEEWKKRKQRNPEMQEKLTQFTDSGIRPAEFEESVLFRELLDLWDVIREFLEKITCNYEIVRIVQQLGKIHMQRRYK